MPSTSQKQHDLMLAVSKNKELAEKLKIDPQVAKEFIKKDEEEGLWQETPELELEDLEAISLEDESISSLIPKSQRNEATEAPLFRMEDRFEQVGDG